MEKEGTEGSENEESKKKNGKKKKEWWNRTKRRKQTVKGKEKLRTKGKESLKGGWNNIAYLLHEEHVSRFVATEGNHCPLSSVFERHCNTCRHDAAGLSSQHNCRSAESTVGYPGRRTGPGLYVSFAELLKRAGDRQLLFLTCWAGQSPHRRWTTAKTRLQETAWLWGRSR
jgi:hypothetical protein